MPGLTAGLGTHFTAVDILGRLNIRASPKMPFSEIRLTLIEGADSVRRSAGSGRLAG